MTTGEKGKVGFQKVYDDNDFISILDETEISTGVVRDRLKQIDEKYNRIHYDWVKKTLIRLADAGKVEMVKLEGSRMYFWKQKEQEGK